jgi:hypothetical protein
MPDHQIILHWDPTNDLVTVKHINEPDAAQAYIGDVIKFSADPPEMKLEVTFTGGSNFSPAPTAITALGSHKVQILGSFPFSCALIDEFGNRHAPDAGDETRHPKT